MLNQLPNPNSSDPLETLILQILLIADYDLYKEYIKEISEDWDSAQESLGEMRHKVASFLTYFRALTPEDMDLWMNCNKS